MCLSRQIPYAFESESRSCNFYFQFSSHLFGKKINNFIAVLRIRDVYLGSRIRLFYIPDPNFSITDPNFSIPDPGSASKKLSVVTKKVISKLYLGIIILFTHPGSQIQGSKRHRIPDPASGSATLLFTSKQNNQRR